MRQKARNVSRVLSRRFDEAFRPHGITGGQYNMLAVIALTNDGTLTELAAHIGLERTTLIRNLKPLEREGFVTVSIEGYRRARSVEITDKGVKKMAAALPSWQKVQKGLKQELGEDVWQAAHTALEALSALE